VTARVRVDEARRGRRQQRAAVADAGAAAATAETRAEVERAVVTAIADADGYRSAWFGRHDSFEEVVEPTVAAGLPVGHLGERLVERGTAEAVEEGRVVVTTDGDRATLTVPVGSEPLGVLYANADRPGGVDAAERDLLADLGATAADAIRRVEDDDGVDATGFTVLSGVLAHELSNQLDIAWTHLGLGRDAEDADPHFEHVEAALGRLESLADETRALARGDVDPERLALADVAEAAWESVDATDATLSARDGTIQADPDLLGLLLENLFRNAVEHGSAGYSAEGAAEAGERADDRPAVRVRVEPLEGGEGFVVADDGVGIPEEERDRVLEWGYSGADGDGVGLGIARVVADRHGWSVGVAESEEGGAAFRFS
jgi:signal transduction histidine kinase